VRTTIHRRYIAIGDSSTEGLNDPDGRGGYRGWSHRLAERLAVVQGSIEYANFAVRGRTTRQIIDQQLPPALALAPDLVSVFSGTNDVLSRRFDVATLERDLADLQRPFLDTGATVLTFTLLRFQGATQGAREDDGCSILRAPRQSRFEVEIKTRFLKPGVFDAQSLVTIPHAKLIRRLGKLSQNQLAEVEAAVRRWLGLE
jgi:lysophospholipase L1-like esterase